MQRFKYKAVNSAGKNVTGILEADSEGAALNALRAKFPIINSIEPAAKQIDALNIEIGSKKVKQEHLVLMCTQMANMLRCGITASKSLELVADSTKNKKLRNILYNTAHEVKGGMSMASAFEKVAPGAFPPTFSETIRAGEESGNVDVAFDTLYKYFEKSTNTTKKIKSALIYPIFIIVIAAVVLVVVMTYVIPSLSGTFEDLGGEMPGITKAMIAMSEFFRDYWYVILIVIVGLIVVYQVINHTHKGHLAIDKIKLKIPVIGKISQYNFTAQFASTLAMFVRSGLPLPKGLEVLSRTFKNMYMRTSTRELVRDIEAGRTLGASMAEKGCFLPTLVSMVSNGEQTGELEIMLESIGGYYQNETDLAVKNALAKLEPTMLCLVAVFAGFIVLSIYLPIFQVYALM